MEQLHREVMDLQRRWRGYLDQPNDPLARQVDSLIQRLEDDIQTKKNPRTLESQIKQVITQLDRLEDTPAMSNPHILELERSFERMQDNLRKLM